VHLPRPGHADLVGVLKYDRADARDVLERASARETTARVAAGAIAKKLLAEFGIRIGSHIVMLGGIEARAGPRCRRHQRGRRRIAAAHARRRRRGAHDRGDRRGAKRAGDTLGGTFEVVARGVPVGLGSHVSWDRKLDGRIAHAMMSIQAMKGVEIGLGFEAARRRGSLVHDEIEADPSLARTGGYRRTRNNAGGLEGGITTGAPIVVRVAMKPLSSLMQPLKSVDLSTGDAGDAVRERSDVVALAAAGVVGEAMLAIVLADAMLEKFGGDSMGEMRRNFDAYLEQLSRRHDRAAAAPLRTVASRTRRPESTPMDQLIRRIVLIGLPGAGKSTVAPILADLLGWRAVDLDAKIVRATGRSVAELFQLVTENRRSAPWRRG
jgi:chorismate synthase